MYNIKGKKNRIILKKRYRLAVNVYSQSEKSKLFTLPYEHNYYQHIFEIKTIYCQ